MTDEQIEKERNEYVDAVIRSFGNNGVPCGIRDIRGMIANGFRDGANFAFSHQWISVDERLPKDDETVLTYSSYGYVLAYYSEQDRMWFAYGNYGDINPTHWLPIPPLNPEKEEV